MLKKLKLTIFIILISLLALVFALQGCVSNKLSINNDARPLYITANKGLTIIDTRTDKIVAEDFDPNYSDSIAAFYKTLLFSEYSGSDFPINISPRANMLDLATGVEKKIVGDQLSFIKKESHFLYGLGFEYDLIFIYDISKKKFNKVKSSEPDIPPAFIGFVNFNRGRAIVLSDIDNIEIRSVDGQRLLSRKKIFNQAALIASNDRVIVAGRQNIKILNLKTNEASSFAIGLPGEYITAFYSNGKLYIGQSTSAEEKPELSTYKVYRITDGKLIKKIKMDVRDYNTLKINDLLVFLDGPHKGYALNLKTSEIEKTGITEQSVVQDGKIYSIVKDRLVIRRGEKILRTIKLSSSAQKSWDDDVSIYNRAIYSSQPTNDNFRIVESL